MIATIVSFLGFVIENVWLLLRYGVINNRNMYLPLLLGYGLAVIVIYFVLGTPSQPKFLGFTFPVKRKIFAISLYFLFVSLFVMAGECGLGIFVEKVMGFVWWDYTALPLNLTRYTSVPTTIAFSTLISLFMGLVFMPLYRRFCSLKWKGFPMLAGLLVLLMTVDFIHSAIYMYQNHTTLLLWSISLR